MAPALFGLISSDFFQRVFNAIEITRIAGFRAFRISASLQPEVCPGIHGITLQEC